MSTLDTAEGIATEMEMKFSDEISSYDVLTSSSSTSFSCPSVYTPPSQSPQHPSEFSENWVWTTSSPSIPAPHQMDPFTQCQETNDGTDGEGYYHVQEINVDSWGKMQEFGDEHVHHGVEDGPSADDLLKAYQLQLLSAKAERDAMHRDGYVLANDLDEEISMIRHRETTSNSSQAFVWESFNIDHGNNFIEQSDDAGQDIFGVSLDIQSLSSVAHPLMGRMNATYNQLADDGTDVDGRTFTVVPSQTVAIPMTPLSNLGDPFQTPVKAEQTPERSYSPSLMNDVLLEASSYKCRECSPSLSSKASIAATYGSGQSKVSPQQSPKSHPRRSKKTVVKKTRMVKGSFGSYLCEVANEPVKKYQCRWGSGALSCPKSFQRQEHRNRHEDIHNPKKGHVCQFCDRPFGRKDNWKQHILKTHLQPAANERNIRYTVKDLERVGIAHEFVPTKRRNRHRK
ncbi:hypothetical protein MMC14_001343 [Varicellaria rhodocarpa]|nr:hypothetical protein [Varicellaria rhodocarpa]